jgi:hypothetical protein
MTKAFQPTNGHPFMYAPPSSMDDLVDEEDRLYMSSLDEEDQEVLFHETPLQKEIIVDGASVTSVEPEEDRHGSMKNLSTS